MASTTYTDFVGPAVNAAWLNDVNTVSYGVLGAGGAVPTTPAQGLANLGGTTLAAVTAQYGAANGASLIGSGAQVTANITGLRALLKTSASHTAVVLGYTTAGDGGGGVYWYNATDTTSSDNGGSIIVAADGGRWYLEEQTTYSVKQFGAVGNGTANDTTAIQNADTYARSLGKALYFPGATYAVNTLTLYTGSNWFGDGRNATTLLQIVGTNNDLIYGNNSNANWGSSAPTLIVNGASIRSMTLNGNWNNGAGNTTGNGISYYGSRPIFEDVFITNIAGHGIRSEYTDGSAGGDDIFTMEGWISDIRIENCGKHGWWNNGPHDTVAINVVVVDAGQSATNTYDGFYFDAKSTGRNISLHSWTRQLSLRMRYSINCQAGSQHEFTGGCNFEGAYTAIANIQSSSCLFDPSTRYYAAWNGTTILMQGTATTNTIMGWCGGSGTAVACAGITLGKNSGDYIADNIIDLHFVTQEANNIVFTSTYDGGNNRIRGRAYNATSASWSGTPNTTDDIDVLVHNSGGTSHFNNRVQKTSLAIGANTGVTWTFPYAFSATPNITYALVGGPFASGSWISSQGPTAVSIYNNSATAGTIVIRAEATN